MKRIVIRADGTWNDRDQLDKTSGKRRPTNVTKVARAVLPRDSQGIDQVVCYHDGIGTGGLVDRLSGGAFGRGMEENIRVLYRCATVMLMAGMNAAFCARQLGHSVEMFHRTYAKWLDGEQNDREMDRLEAAIAAKPGAGRNAPAKPQT